MTTLDEVMDSLSKEIAELVAKRAIHVSAMHETEAAKQDVDGAYRYCDGCRLNMLTTVLSEITSTREDTRPVKRAKPEGGFETVMRLDAVLEHARKVVT